MRNGSKEKNQMCNALQLTGLHGLKIEKLSVALAPRQSATHILSKRRMNIGELMILLASEIRDIFAACSPALSPDAEMCTFMLFIIFISETNLTTI